MSVSPRRIPTYRFHRATGKAIVRLGTKVFYLGKFGSEESHREYNRLTAEWLACDGSLTSLEKPNDISVLELTAAFWQHAEQYYRKPDGSSSSELDVFRLALRPVIEMYGDTLAKTFGPLALRAVRQRMIEMNWARTLINKQVSRVKHVFKWGVGQELIPPTVHQALVAVEGLKKGKSEAKESAPVKPVPEAHIDAIKPFVSPQVWAMIELQRITGMRPGEVLIMRGIDIDMANSVWVYRPQYHKTERHGYSRDVWLGPKAQEVVRPFLKADVNAHLFSPKDAEAHRRANCPTHRRANQKPTAPQTDRALRDRYDVASYRRAIARGCVKAFPVPDRLCRKRLKHDKAQRSHWESLADWKKRLGDEQWQELRHWHRKHKWHPHQLRHNAATRLRRQFGIEAARVILGHRSAGITEIYAEQDQEKGKRIMEEVG